MIENDYVPGVKPAGGAALLMVISGCSGGGKSTLMAELARRGYATFSEPGRQIVREQMLIGGNALPWEDMERFIEQCVVRAIHFHTIAKPEGRPVFFDRSLVDAVSALAGLGCPVPDHYRRAIEMVRYARTVFLAPPWEALFESDGERRHGFAEAAAEYERLLADYPAFGYEAAILPKTSVAARADFIEAELKRRRVSRRRSNNQQIERAVTP